MTIEQLIKNIVADFKKLPQVEAITLSGASVNNRDELSDYDFYVYIDEEIPIKTRTDIANKYSNHFEINNQFWETGDEWETDLTIIDIMFRDKKWIKDDLERVIINCQASVGYTTAIWFNVVNSVILYDRNNWFKSLQEKVTVEYPEKLKKAIVAKNYPILRNTISSYFVQIKKAIKREDIVSINHRTTAFLVSYFDILFAINRKPHPGEKRLVERLKLDCKILPKNLEQHLQDLILDISINNLGKIINTMNKLVDALNDLLKLEKLI